MPAKYICALSREELKRAYLDEGRTLKEMCAIIGVKSRNTASKILREHGISTNANERLVKKSMNGMDEKEFKKFLVKEYYNGKSMIAIGEMLGITPSAVRKYFVKYGIETLSRKRNIEGSSEGNPNWKGGVRHKKNGYVEIYSPEHPNANKRKCIYEHQLVMEEYIGRYIKPGEVIHHIDGNKSNNDISNLLLLTNSDHVKLHAILKRSKKLMGEFKKGDDSSG